LMLVKGAVSVSKFVHAAILRCGHNKHESERTIPQDS
jgi:hypothetical protein